MSERQKKMGGFKSNNLISEYQSGRRSKYSSSPTAQQPKELQLLLQVGHMQKMARQSGRVIGCYANYGSVFVYDFRINDNCNTATNLAYSLSSNIEDHKILSMRADSPRIHRASNSSHFRSF